MRRPRRDGGSPRSEPVIWAFWHNRVFTAPLAYRRFLAGRSGAVLTSASK
ncbi:MAG: hypothetical protein R3F11_31570 [Verrucomicrobiales bacterium]